MDGPHLSRMPGRILGPAAVAAAVLAAGVSIRRGPEAGPVALALGVAWGLVLLTAMAGWGRLAGRVLAPERRIGPGMRAALGLAVTVAVGGVLDLAGVISPAVVLAYVASGAGLLAWRPDRPASDGEAASPWRSPGVAAGLVLVLGLGLVQLAGAVNGSIDTTNDRPAFDVHDDLQAYLVFPEKMLETGSMGRDPFEPRRVLSLGGQSFLQTLVLVARPVRAIHLLDEGLAVLILLGLVLGTVRTLGVGAPFGILMAFLALAMPHLPMRGNTSALLTGVVFLLAWFLLEMERDTGAEGPSRRPGEWLLLALPAAAACAVKSTFIAFAVPFFLAAAAADLAGRDDRRRALAESAATAGMILLLVTPWMVSSYRSSGTPLYPVLGAGFLGEASTHGFPAVSGDFDLRPIDVVRSVWKHAFVLWPVAVLAVFAGNGRRRRPALALAGAALAAAVLYVLAGDPNLNRSLNRYVFPVFVTGLLGLEVAAFEGTGVRAGRGLGAAAMAGLVMAGAVLVHEADRAWRMGDQVLVNVWHGVRGDPCATVEERDAVSRLQAAVPAGAPFLETLAKPFLLDPSRNSVLLMSLPGFSSPPPGLPAGRGGEALAGYLLGQGVRYLAYGGVRGVRDLLNLTEADIRGRYPRSRMRWVMLRYHELYRRDVLDLAVSRRVLFQDGRRLVIDLAVRENVVYPALVPDRSGFFPDHGWTDGHGVLEHVGWSVPRGGGRLVLELDHAHPDWARPETLGVRIVADGVMLDPLGATPGRLVFAVPPGMRTIGRLEIISSTFVPQLRGIGRDGRTLGVPVERIRLLGAGGEGRK